MIIAGDVGGTKSNLALLSKRSPTSFDILTERTLVSKNYPSLEALVGDFLAVIKPELGSHAVEAACLGVAAPIVGKKIKTPNLPWVIDVDAVQATFGKAPFRLINDLESTGYGIATLKPDELMCLNKGEARPHTHQALIAAGTGLGEALLYWNGSAHLPSASEGGHSTFSPNNSDEMGLLSHLLKKFPGHVSWERVLSGPGLFNIYSYLKETNFAPEPEWLKQEIAAGDPSAAVSRAGLEKKCELAAKTLDMFAALYGAEAGNVALKFMGTGGLYLGGGIAPKLKDKLSDGTFMTSFCHKGRLSALMQTIPVHIILNQKTALFGSARAAVISGGAASYASH